jgi:CelD/BcsL family acetyltransferase involved in cellulose biosynthesis
MVNRAAAEGREEQRSGSALDASVRRSGVEWIRDTKGFDAVRAEWDALAERERFPFLRHAWFSAWWRAFGAGSTLEVCLFWDRGALAGAFPLARRDGRLESLAHPHHAPVYRPLARDGAALESVVEAVLDARPGELVVHSLPDGDPALASIARRAGRPFAMEPEHVSPLVDTGGDLETYRASLNRSKRKELERLRRRFAEAHDVRVDIDSPADVDAALAALFALEELGWKGARGTAMGQEQGVASFYDGVARGFHADGRLRLARLLADERLVAADLCLLDHRRLWVLKGAYDEEFARFAPGLSLAYAEVEWCFGQELEGLELLGDDEPWKRTFATGARRHLGLRCYRRRPVPLARFAYRRAIRPALRTV